MTPANICTLNDIAVSGMTPEEKISVMGNLMYWMREETRRLDRVQSLLCDPDASQDNGEIIHRYIDDTERSNEATGPCPQCGQATWGYHCPTCTPRGV